MKDRLYLVIWLALLALLTLTAWAVQLPLGPGRLILHLGTAVIMAALVMVFYMGLRQRDGLLRLFALGGLVWLALLLGFSLAEVLTRG